MVLLHFPSSLTDEEQMLQAKYAKLRKKKKQVAALKNQSSNKGDEMGLKLKSASSASASMSSLALKKKSLGSAETRAKDAKEVAKKLIRSGTINLQPAGERERGEKSAGFKRSQGLERKLTGLDNARAGYQPFSATHGPGGGFDTGGEDLNPDPPEPPPKKVKNLYDSFVAARDREERGLAHSAESRLSDLTASSLGRSGPFDANRPRQGNTIYIFGYQITEDILKKVFGPVGKIVNISMEVEKNCGFITFDKPEAAETAISEQNGNIVEGIQLKVSMARRQPVIDPINDASSSATWSTIAASHSQKGSHKDKRELVAYEEIVARLIALSQE